MINEKVRKHLKICAVEYGFRQYQLAEMCGFSEERFSKLLTRTQLPDDVEDCLISAIDDAIQGNNYDLKIFDSWRFQRIMNRYELGRVRRIEHAPDAYKKRMIEKSLDEAEARRILGGWDLSL